MKKITILILATLFAAIAATPAFSTEFFFKKIDENDEDDVYWAVDIDTAREHYKHYTALFSDVFNSRVLRVLLGEKDLLNDRIENLFDLAKVDNRYLRLLRNMVYARYGLIFKSDDLNTFFGKHKWYKPERDNVDRYLTNADKHNVRVIQAFEGRNEKLPNANWGTEKERVGIWQDMSEIPSGWSNRFVVFPKNRMEYHISQMEHMKIYAGMAGAYSIKGNVLEFSVGEVWYVMPPDFDISVGPGGYEWANYAKNSIKLEKNIIFKFPISDVSAYSKTDTIVLIKNNSERHTHFRMERISIGGQWFYKKGDDPSKAH